MTRALWVAACLGLAPAMASAGPEAVPAPRSPAAAGEGTAEVTYAYVRRGSETVKVPLFAPESAATPIAQIDDEVIRLDELTEALAASHDHGTPRRPGSA